MVPTGFLARLAREDKEDVHVATGTSIPLQKADYLMDNSTQAMSTGCPPVGPMAKSWTLMDNTICSLSITDQANTEKTY